MTETSILLEEKTEEKAKEKRIKGRAKSAKFYSWINIRWREVNSHTQVRQYGPFTFFYILNKEFSIRYGDTHLYRKSCTEIVAKKITIDFITQLHLGRAHKSLKERSY